MRSMYRLEVVCAVLMVAGLVAFDQVSAESGGKKNQLPLTAGSHTARKGVDAPDDIAFKFGRGGIVTYQKQASEDTFFAFQLHPKLESPAEMAAHARLIMVDTSASQAGQSLASSILLAEQLIKQAQPSDRIAIWTINVPSATRDLTKGFHNPDSPQLHAAVQALRQEVPLGDTDLPNGLMRAASAFEGDMPHQELIYLGDGMSLHRPMSVEDRVKLCASLVRRRIAFFSVPIGPHLDSTTLHGMAVSTGGLVVRPHSSDRADMFVKRLCEVVSEPILYPNDVSFSSEVIEFLPRELPPLRRDAPTLMVGRFKLGKELTCEVTGSVAGQDIRLRMSEPVLEPEADNFFLVSMVAQWRAAKDQPALLRSDRALAFAQQLNVLAREELLGQAQLALVLDHVDAAGRLFEQAKKLDPNDLEADGGQRLVALLRDGKVNKQDLRKQLTKRDGNALLIEKEEHGKAVVRRDVLQNLVAQVEAGEKEAAIAPRLVAQDDGDLLKQQRLKQAVEEQHVTEFVNDALRQANRLVKTDPDGANELVKRALTLVRDNADVRESVKIGLINRLENAARNVAHDGARVKRDQEERLRLLALAESRSAELTAKLTEEDRTRERMRVYRNLMNQARYEDAFNQGLAMLQDAIDQGQPVPVAVTAAKDIGLAAHNLREVQGLKRVREERYLLTMMQVERSHVPFPDEPPIQFPPAAAWRRLTEQRKERYESSGLSDDDPVTLKKLKELKDKLAMSVTMDGFEPNTPLQEALGFLSERFAITTLIDVEAFKADLMIVEPENQPVKLPRMVNVSLGTVLRLLLAQAQATFIIRRDYIEITTPQRQAAEKTLRVYPVADLVTPIPNSVNQQAVNQTQSNAFSGAAGASLMGMMGMGGLGLMGLGGLGLGGLGIGGLGLGGMNMGIAGGGIAGAGQGGGFGGVNGFAGAGAQGIGAGGNLGGQFGLQGGDTSGLLLRLITQVVGKPEDWAPINPLEAGGAGNAGNAGFGGGFNGNMAGFGGMGMGLPPVDPNEGAGDPNQAGSLGYYPPTRALIVKATSRIHTRLGGGMMGPRPPVEGANADRPPQRDVFVIAPGKKPVHVGGAADKKPLANKQPSLNSKKRALPTLDATRIWQNALARSKLEPGLIIAAADFLVERGQFGHAAEFLKANLRHGIVVKPWVYEALAIALKMSKGSAEEIERAQLSVVDVQPQDAQGYVRASGTMSDNKRWDRAVAYCRQASLLEPNSPRPYADAMIYAERIKDTEAIAWAAGNVLSRDWPFDNQILHRKADDALRELRNILESEQRSSRAQALEVAARQHRQRDLSIKLTWLGDADLDLEVTEPIGTVCSFLQRQTLGGGTLIGDQVGSSRDEMYIAAQAFSGEYKIQVRKIWGRPLGSKATLEIVEHDGTPEQRILVRDRIAFDRTHTLSVNLRSGRRKSVAQISSLVCPRQEAHSTTSDRSLHQLQSLVDADAGTSVRGGFGHRESSASPKQRLSRPRTRKLPSVVASGIEMTLQPVLANDHSVLGMSLQPIFETLGSVQNEPIVINPVIPGSL